MTDDDAAAARERIAALEQALLEREGQLAQSKAELVKTRVLAESAPGLPAAYQALVPASDDPEAVRGAAKEALEQYQADMASAQRATPARGGNDLRIGAPAAGPATAPLPRWHGRKPSEIPVEDWPTYRREVLGLR